MLPGCDICQKPSKRHFANVRKPEHLPTVEIHAAVLSLPEANHGATRNEIPTAVARLFGFQATSSQLKKLIDSQIQTLVRIGKIEEINGTFKARYLKTPADPFPQADLYSKL
jgi:hypothetical protein